MIWPPDGPDAIGQHTAKRLERKIDRYFESTNRAIYAGVFARVGLASEAIAELRTMLEEPGGNGFRFIDQHPVFDSLKDNPAYEALREKYATVR